jgi:hypothetical protein
MFGAPAAAAARLARLLHPAVMIQIEASGARPGQQAE